MAGEFEGMQVRGDGDEAMGATMINVAMALMRETKDAVERVDRKLDKIAEERREEAREHGGLEVRVAGLEKAMPRAAEERIATLETSHKAVRGVAFTVAGTLTLGVIYWLIRMAVLHPETVGK